VQQEDGEDFDKEQRGDDVDGAEKTTTEEKMKMMTKKRGLQISIKCVIKSVTFHV
jgi:hypothetical protein